MEREKINEIMSKVLGELGKKHDEKSSEQKVEVKSRAAVDTESPQKTYPILRPFHRNSPVLITEEYLRKTVPNGGIVLVEGNYIITPSARDFIRKNNVEIKSTSSVPEKSGKEEYSPEIKNTVAIGSDHRGYPLKEFLKKSLMQQGYKVIDVGTFTAESCDYPDYAIAVAKKVSSGQVYLGIAIDSAGIGSAIAANKIEGIRAAVCWDDATAEQSRMHNNANLMCIGADNLAPAKALSMVNKFLSAKYIPNERYDRRLKKIADAEKNK